MTIIVRIGDARVTLPDVVNIACTDARIELDSGDEWRNRIITGRGQLMDAIENGTVIYGMNTGVGNSSKIQLRPGNETRLQTCLLAQHGCGVGPDLSEFEARAVMVSRLISLCKGYSAVRIDLLEQLATVINTGIVPAIPRYGSVGASGDLTPLSYIGAMLMGERSCYLNGKRLDAGTALARAGLGPFQLAAKEGIAIINGTSVMTALGIMAHRRAWHCCEVATRATALATEVLLGDSCAFEPIIHEQKPYPGQIRAAVMIMDSLRGSSLIRWQGEQREAKSQKTNRTVQDRYSLRCSPHIIGAAWDALDWTETILTTELNSVNDNPMVDPSTGKIYAGGNFYGGHVALVLDTMKVAMASVCDLLDRQFALLVDESENRGLPENLLMPRTVDDPEFGLYHGLKGLQITMSALTALAIQRAHSDTLTSRPTEAGNQDKVSMGTNAAHNALAIVDLVEHCLAILLVALSQAAYIRNEGGISPAGRQLVAKIRQDVAIIERDRPLDTELPRLVARIKTAAFNKEPTDADRIARPWTQSHW